MHNRVVHPRGAAGVTVSCEEGMHITDDGVHMFYRLANPEGAGFPLVMVQVGRLEGGSSPVTVVTYYAFWRCVCRRSHPMYCCIPFLNLWDSLCSMT